MNHESNERNSIMTLRFPPGPEEGQATAEYVLVIVAAGAVALSLIVWASSSGVLESLFDAVVSRVRSYV